MLFSDEWIADFHAASVAEAAERVPSVGVSSNASMTTSNSAVASTSVNATNVLTPVDEVYKKSRIWSDHRWRKFGGGITCVQWEKSLRRLRGVAQRLQKLNKVDIFSLKMSKIDLPPFDLKISNFLLDLDIKHLFWACWIEKTYMEVTMWVGGRGAP